MPDRQQTMLASPVIPAPEVAADDLLPLAISQPDVASMSALRILGAGPAPRERSFAHHALAIVERDRGRIDAAFEQGRAALRSATRVGPDREAEVRATLGSIHVFAGETRQALRQLDRAIALGSRTGLPRALHLRGCTFWLLGRYDEAVLDLERSRALSRRARDRLWEGRTLGVLGDVHRARGDVSASERAYAAAEVAHLEIGAPVEAALASRGRALVALESGDVVGALERLEEVEERFREAGVDPIDEVVFHVEALLTARLAGEAHAMADRALARADLAPAFRADLLLASSKAAMLEGDWAVAEARARDAEQIFRAHRRERWAARSSLLALEAAHAGRRAAGEADEEAVGARVTRPAPVPTDEAGDWSDLLAETRRLVTRLRRLDDRDLPGALLLLAQVATAAGSPRVAAAALREAADARHRGAPLTRAAGWLASALLADHEGDRRRMRHACRRGLDAIDEHRSLIGDLELRALASGYGLDLVALALRDAVRTGDARGLLWWAERWRASALSGAARPPDDPALTRDIAALRDVTRRLADDDEPPLRREQARLEASVRTRYRRLRSEARGSGGLDLPGLVEALGDTTLVALVGVGSGLHAVTVADGRVDLRPLGGPEILREADFARFALRRAAHGRRVDLAAAGARLQGALFRDPHPAWSRPSVLVAPTNQLLTVPFGMLPVFAESVVTVTPSSVMWKQAVDRHAARGRTPDGHVALVTGPGLSTEQREVAGLRRLHRDPVVLGGDEASVASTLAVLDGARLAHIAAHGIFRADAPLFSHLVLADGPLMIHDLDRLATPPDAVVLSACDSGGVSPIGASEALGLVSSLLAMGTRSVVASIDPINDAATERVMAPLHEAVAQGSTLAEGLLAARRASRGDMLLEATAAAFTAWGA